MLKNNQGFTLVESLVAMGLVAVLMLGIVGYVVYQKMQIRDQALQNLQTDFHEQVEDYLSAPGLCKNLLPTDSGLVSSQPQKSLDVAVVNRELSSLAFEIVSATITSTASLDANTDATSTDTVFSSYVGTLNMQVALKAELNQTMKSSSYLVKNISVPIRLYGETAQPSWNNVKCSSMSTETAFYIGQICNLYGGLLSDGLHCDFPKTAQIHLPTTNNSNVSVEKISNASNRVTRVNMSEMLCYVDTLMTLTENLPGPVTRNYTRYCQLPGGNTLSRVSRTLTSKPGAYPSLQP